MTPEQPIDGLVQDVSFAMFEAGALFGFVFQPTSDRRGFLRGRPLTGEVSEIATLRQYYKPIGNLAMPLMLAGENRSIKVDAPADLADPKHDWYALIITKALDPPACVAVLTQVKDQAEASIRLKDLARAIESRPFRSHLKFDRLTPLLAKLRFAGCAVYCLRGSGEARALHLLGTIAARKTSSERSKEMGESILKIVRECYRTRSDRIVPPRDTNLPNAAGRRYWHFILATGRVLEVGYVISVVVAARDEAEAREAMAAVQNDPIWRGKGNTHRSPSLNTMRLPAFVWSPVSFLRHLFRRKGLRRRCSAVV